MRGFVQSWFVLLFVVGAAGCGSVPAAKTDAGTTDAAADGGTEGCTPNAFVCGEGDALFQCDEMGVTLTKVQDCQYGCNVDACNECEANTTFCSGDELVQCDENGKIVNPMSCQYGCQMDRCNTCEPGVAYCDGANAVTCGDDGLPGATMACGAAGCAGGVCNACQPNTTTCQGDKLVVCNANGQVSSTTDCALGCSATGGAHCRTMSPLYGVGTPSGSLPALTVTANGSLDVSNCPTSVTLKIGNETTVINGAPQVSQVAQSGGPPICVVRFGSITVNSGFTFSIINNASPGHVVSLQSIGDVQIAGTISFVNSATGPRPGGNANVIGTNGDGKRYAPGAGGGGAARAGGAGGKYSSTNGGAGGAAVTTIMSVLTGGSKGGNVMQGTTVVASGGQGGGGLQIISLSKVTVAATGRLVVNGNGGTGPGLLTGADLPAGGGGSGGTLVVEAPTINMSANALAVANGGGGAGGCYTCSLVSTSPPLLLCSHNNGQSGQLSATRAAGGDCTNGGGDGGWEANGATNPSSAGENWSTTAGAGGGGGGSDGFVILRARTASQVTITNGAVVSPMPTIGAVNAN